MNKEHWKQKKRRHDRWIAKAKAANKVLDAPKPGQTKTRLCYSQTRTSSRHANVKMTGSVSYSTKLKNQKKAITYTFSVYSAYKKDPKSSLGIP